MIGHKKLFTRSSPRMATSLGHGKEAIHYNLKNKDIEPSLSHNQSLQTKLGFLLDKGEENTRAHLI